MVLSRLLYLLPLVVGQTSAWQKLPAGSTWVNRAWCEPGVKCGQHAINDETAVLINWYYTDANDVQAIKNMGKVAMCYMSAGSMLPDERKNNPDVPLGKSISGYDLRWVSILPGDQAKVQPWMSAKLEEAARRGCQTVELDNVDCWQNDCLDGQKAYSPEMRSAQVAYLKWLAGRCHELGMGVGLKNTLGLVVDLVDDFDYAVNEQCLAWNECGLLKPFLDQNKAILATSTTGSVDRICTEAKKYSMSMLYDLDDSGWKMCPMASAAPPPPPPETTNPAEPPQTTNTPAPTPTETSTPSPTTTTTTGPATWSNWSAWSDCTRICGTGVMTRERTCSTGKNDDCFGDYTSRRTCNKQGCGWDKEHPYGQWSEWGVWTPCSKSCNGGVMTRSRECKDEAQSCRGDWAGRRLCNTQPC